MRSPRINCRWNNSATAEDTPGSVQMTGFNDGFSFRFIIEFRANRQKCRMCKRMFNSSTVDRWLKQAAGFSNENDETPVRDDVVETRQSFAFNERVCRAHCNETTRARRLEIRCNSSEITPRLLFIIYYYHTQCSTRARVFKGIPGALLVRHSLSSRRERITMPRAENASARLMKNCRADRDHLLFVPDHSTIS